MNTFLLILGVCGLLEFFYFKQKWNVLLAIITAVSWLGLMVYTLTNPPVNITAGSWLQEVLMLVFLGMATVNLYMWFRNRDNKFSENGRSEFTEEEEKTRQVSRKSPMQMSENEYKAYLRSRRQAK
jgi:hypothetical protein